MQKPTQPKAHNKDKTRKNNNHVIIIYIYIYIYRHMHDMITFFISKFNEKIFKISIYNQNMYDVEESKTSFFTSFQNHSLSLPTCCVVN